MNNVLSLLSGIDIPFDEAHVTIHQPTLKEISYIGQDNFYIGCEYLTFSKEKIESQDKVGLDNIDDFDILMTVMKSNQIATQKGRTAMQLVLLLLFPSYKINFLPMSILLTKDQERYLIDKSNFNSFKQIISEIFCLSDFRGDSKQYNPGGPQAKALVQKFKARQKKLAELKARGKKDQGISILSQYISILSVGLGKDMNSILQYTVYQLFDEFRRFKMKSDFDIYIKAKLAGAQDLEDVDNWMENIH